MALKPGAVTDLDAQMLEDIAGDAPTMDLAKEDALKSIPEVMVTVGLQPSKAAAKRHASIPVQVSAYRWQHLLYGSLREGALASLERLWGAQRRLQDVQLLASRVVTPRPSRLARLCAYDGLA